MEGVTLGQILLTVASGATSLLVLLVFRRLGEVAKGIEAIREKVGEHAEQLAEGKAKIEALQRQAADLDTEMRKLVRDGCARGQSCIRSAS